MVGDKLERLALVLSQGESLVVNWWVLVDGEVEQTKIGEQEGDGCEFRRVFHCDGFFPEYLYGHVRVEGPPLGTEWSREC